MNICIPPSESNVEERTPRITARFVPQAWMNNYAVNVDPEGDVAFDVTDYVLSLPREEALALRDDTYESDYLRDLATTAPSWVREWTGPFYIEVEQAIEDFFESLTETP